MHFRLTLVALFAILWASLTPWFPEIPNVEDVPFYDKWAHFLMYGVLTLIVQWECYWLTRDGYPLTAIHWTILCAIMPVAWGILMELAQAYLTNYRTGDPIDAFANIIGVVIGLVLGHRSSGRKRSRFSRRRSR